MSTIINGVNFDPVIEDAIAAGIAAFGADNAGELRGIAENITRGLANDVAFLAQKKASGEFNEDDARAFLEDQKIVARVRLRSIAIVNLQIAEQIWNAMAKVFRSATLKALGWNIF